MNTIAEILKKPGAPGHRVMDPLIWAAGIEDTVNTDHWPATGLSMSMR
jgi:hypothetical protein